MKDRKKSSIAGLRFFHNWIKRTTIEDAATFLKRNYGVHNIKLLDLAVGKGGDMRKWYDSHIYDVVGIDIDDASINDKGGAKDRYQQFKREVNRPTNYSFHVFDLSNPENIPKIDKIIGDKKFNVVSCQFAIHYFFRSPESLDTFMNIVTRYMDKNAIFIGTTMDGEKIRQMFTQYGETVNKELYSLKNLSDLTSKSPYGNTYIASLGKTEGEEHYFVDKPSEEYMFDINELKRVADKYGLIFAGVESFDKWYNDYPKRGLVSQQEKEFSFMNLSFAFKKSIS